MKLDGDLGEERRHLLGRLNGEESVAKKIYISERKYVEQKL
jgi:hypothetical protein